MEKLINKTRYEEAVTYQILGGERQALQICLMPGQSIITKKDTLLYSSENITQSNVIPNFISRVLNVLQLKKSELCLELKNESGSIGYIGLQIMKGRVIIIDNEVTPKMIVKEKYVLARTPNVDLVPSWSHGEGGRSSGLKEIKSNKLPILDARGNSQTVRDLVREEADKSLADHFKDQTLKSSELVFLQSQSNFIEKTLGANEKMKIRPECVVAFSESVNIHRDFGAGGLLQMFSSRGKFVTLTGPGLVYIDMQVGSRFFKKDQLSLYVVVLYFMLYFIMFLIVTFDRRLERMVGHAAGGGAQ